MQTQSNTDSTIQTHTTSEASVLLSDPHYQEENALRSFNRETSIKYMIFEQSRRAEDPQGEDARRALAKRVSDMFKLEGKSASNFSFAMTVREALKRAGSQISINAAEATETAGEAGKKGWSLLRSKVGEVTKLSQKSETKLNHAVSEARIAFVNSTIQITKLSETIGEKTSSTAIDATNKSAALIVRGRTGLDLVLFHARTFIKELATRFSGWIQKTWNDAVLQSHLNYSTLLEKREQKRRTVSDADETFAVLNAMRVSALIKDLAPEFYRPTEEPNSLYAIQLLEDKERKRRVAEDKLDKNLRARLKAVADIAVAGKAHQVKPLEPAYTIESVIELPIKPAHIEAMQIFEEPRSVTEMISCATPVKALGDELTYSDSPKARSAAM